MTQPADQDATVPVEAGKTTKVRQSQPAALPDGIITALIAMGASRDLTIPRTLIDTNATWNSLLCGGEPWRRLAEQLDEAPLANLIRGLVLYSRASGTSGGSVSPVIALHSGYCRRFHSTEPDLSSWIVSNRSNEWEPWGTRSDARSLHEHLELLAARRQAKEDAKRRREAVEQAHRSANATSKLADAVRRGDLKAVQALVQKGADLSAAAPPDCTLLELAVRNSRDAVAAYLRSLGQT